VDELLKQRRTTRFFKNRNIERTTLAEILSYGGYAPTNNYRLRAVAVDNPSIMHELDELQMRSLIRYYNLIFRFNIVFIILEKISPLVTPILKKKFENGLELGTNFETLPSALIFIIGDHRILLSEASAQYAAYNMMLYAQTKKLGTRFMAAGLTTLNRMPRVRNLLGLTGHEHILSAFELGYPAVHFFNKVEGKDMRVEFVGEENRGGQ
jgi:nitroreductase